ncbi:MAG: hypothetical protein ACTS43_00525 [Candidatus Hodgkinia cicadicola]
MAFGSQMQSYDINSKESLMDQTFFEVQVVILQPNERTEKLNDSAGWTDKFQSWNHPAVC